jgi:hypothetical protein
VKYPGLLQELTTEKKNREQDLEDLDKEESEITKSLIPLMEDLAEVLEQSGNMDQKVRNNLDSVVHTIDSEALNQKIEEDRKRCYS